MSKYNVHGAISNLSTFSVKKESSADHSFKWDSIKSFICIADAFACTAFNYDAFSHPGVAMSVPLFLFLFLSVLVGMPYMCMEFFIKQYTGRINLQQSLNPLLKAVNYGIISLSTLWCLKHANDLADSILFFISTLSSIPSWSECTKNIHPIGSAQKCVSTKNITIICAELLSKKKFINLNTTSAHYNYVKLFRTNDRSSLTKRFFLVAVVWITNFFCCTFSDHILVKLFNLAFIFRNTTTILFAFYVIGSSGEHINEALKDMLNYPKQYAFTYSTSGIMYVFGAGVVGVYDFGTLTPYLIVDNAVIMFTVTFIAFGFLRSLSIAVLLQVVKRCVITSDAKIKLLTNHYFLFVVLPLSADFLYAQRILTMYLYICLCITNATHIAAITYAISKILHSEFSTVELMYITGILCFMGFALSIPVGMNNAEYFGYYDGCSTCMIFLAALKSGIVMYLYGVQNFATDIHFWLGFKPTKYWIITWSLLPAVTFIVYLRWVSRFCCYNTLQPPLSQSEQIITIFIPVLVLVLGLVTVIRYMSVNNLTGLFRTAYKYGPPDADERKRRRNYDALSLHQCTHNCVILDNKIDCNHMPITFIQNIDDSIQPEEISILSVFEAESSKKVNSPVNED